MKPQFQINDKVFKADRLDVIEIVITDVQVFTKQNKILYDYVNSGGALASSDNVFATRKEATKFIFEKHGWEI